MIQLSASSSGDLYHVLASIRLFGYSLLQPRELAVEDKLSN